MKILTLRAHRLHSNLWRWLWRVASAGLGAWLLLAAASAVVRADQDPEVSPGAAEEMRDGEGDESRISIGVLSGATLYDPALADYQWRTSPATAWGGQALLGFGRYATGLRLWTATTEQLIEASNQVSATVRATSWEAVGQRRLGHLASAELVAVASLGRLHLGYHPDRVTVTSGGNPIVVELAPIDEWVAGGGFAIKRRLGGSWGLGLEVDRRFFGLDTAHRDGASIVERREWFGDWNAHLELARLIAR